MLAFEVSVNGMRRYVAGHADARMLNISIQGSVLALAAMAGSSFGVRGWVAVPSTVDGGLHTLSYPEDRLSVGDEVTIRIVEVDRADLPTERNTGDGSVEIVADAG